MDLYFREQYIFQIFSRGENFGIPAVFAGGGDQVGPVIQCLEDKFRTIKNGKGIAFAVPLSGVIGVNTYQFLSNYKKED